LRSAFPGSRFPSSGAAAKLLSQLAEKGLSGGAIYDALVGAAAAEHGIKLVTKDAQAAQAYHLLGVGFELLC